MDRIEGIKQILEGARDIQCQMAKEGGLPACSKCEELKLKPVCSIRHCADDIFTYLRSQGRLEAADEIIPGASKERE